MKIYISIIFLLCSSQNSISQIIKIPKNLFREKDTILVLNKIYTLKNNIFLDKLKDEVDYKKLEDLKNFLNAIKIDYKDLKACIFVHDSTITYQFNKPPSYNGVQGLRVALSTCNVKYFISCSYFQGIMDNFLNNDKVEILFYIGSIKTDKRMQNKNYKYFKAISFPQYNDPVIVE